MGDPVTTQILIGLATEGIADLIRQLARWDDEIATDPLSVSGPSDSVTSAIEQALSEATDVPKISDDLGGEALRAFLASPEAAQSVQQLYTATFGSDPRAVKDVRQQFVASLTLWTGAAPDAAANGARLFDVLAAATEKALDQAVANGLLAAKDAKDAARFSILRSELGGLQKNLALLRSDAIDLDAVLRFHARYRQQVDARESFIVPPDLDRYEKRPIDSLYVAPRLVLPDASGRNQYGTYSHLLQRLHRVVLLGDPGGGKSTLTLKVCHDLATDSSPRTVRGLTVTPILVVLREYGARKKEAALSLLDFIEEQARTKYQIDTVPDGAFEYFLRNGRAIVIFDGLDELLDTSYRREISGDVEAFSNLYPSAPILVTSRRVGYDQAPLSGERFETLQLADFDDGQIRAYVQKVFALQIEDEADRVARVASFVEESRVVPDLASNPLMLGLICNIYKGQGYIPSNRPDVFEKCAVMLFESWDQRRDIRVDLPFQSKLRPAMQFLANWIYGDPQLRAGITQDRLVSKATEYLHGRQFEDADEARAAAHNFIDVCKGRAWVFTDTGSTADGEALFQFTHQTFLEFFTADYLVRTHNSPDALLERLVPHIGRQEWDVVAQLALQLQTKYIEDAADGLLQRLIDHAGAADPDTALNLVSFGARSLEFLVPSPAISRLIVQEVCTKLIQLGASRLESGNDSADDSDLSVGDDRLDTEILLAALGESGQETRASVQREITSALGRYVYEEGPVSFVAVEAVRAIHGAARQSKASQRECRGAESWLTFARSFMQEHLPRLRLLGTQDRRVAADLLFFGLESTEYMLEHHGLAGLFQNRGYVLLTHVKTLSPASLGLRSTVMWFPDDFQQEFWSQEILSSLGQMLQTLTPPWLSPDEIASDAWFAASARQPSHDGDPQGWTPDQVFGAFAVAAVMLESATPHERETAIEALEGPGGRAGMLKVISPWLLSRWRDSEPGDLSYLPQSAAVLVEGWCRGDVELLG